METRDAIRSVVENILSICQLKPEQEECLVHNLLPTGFGKSLMYQLLPIVSGKQVSVSKKNLLKIGMSMFDLFHDRSSLKLTIN